MGAESDPGGKVSEPRDTPPDEWWGDEEPERDDDREPEPRIDDWDVQDWQDAGGEW